MSTPKERELLRLHMKFMLAANHSTLGAVITSVTLEVLSELEAAEESLRQHGEAVIRGLTSAGEAS